MYGRELPMPPRLAARELAKHYGGVEALRGVSLHVDAGEVLGLVGDNGAGKSTVAKILSGATFPSAGQVLLEGQRDVVANFFLGREQLSGGWLGRRTGWLDRRAMAEHTRRELARLRTRIPDVHLPARDLSGGQRQAL